MIYTTSQILTNFFSLINFHRNQFVDLNRLRSFDEYFKSFERKNELYEIRKCQPDYVGQKSASEN